MAAFSKFLGMPTEGFEKEILALLRRIKACKGHECQRLSRSNGKFVPSCFKRELKKLEWSVSYKWTNSENEGTGSGKISARGL